MNKVTDHTKVWVYQSNRPFSDKEIITLSEKLKAFTDSWTAHGSQLNAWAEILYNHFIVLFVNEDVANASGCSIDSSIKFLKEIETEFDITLFNRLLIAYKDQSGNIKIVNQKGLNELVQKGIITDEAIVFNNAISTGKSFISEWEVPLKNSWLKKLLLSEVK